MEGSSCRRLSLCLTELGNTKGSVRKCKIALELPHSEDSPFVLPACRPFLIVWQRLLGQQLFAVLHHAQVTAQRMHMMALLYETQSENP